MQLFCSGVTVEASFFGLVVAGCHGAVLQTEHCEQYSGVGLSAAVAGWGCFGSHSSELLYAADTGNDYNYRLEERRDGAVSRVVCSVLLLRHVMLLCPRDIN